MAAIQDVNLECRIILVRNAKCEFIAKVILNHQRVKEKNWNQMPFQLCCSKSGVYNLLLLPAALVFIYMKYSRQWDGVIFMRYI